uniref:Potassium channel toxin MeuTXKalpha2 n=1 Tax=Mesobuthus eupeus TaxID=34648 RepID=KAX8R_MESEU|nr:RecName: Full=Potassium channel toxin MeuTXKalpha2; Flags: Precursor [Mesobuthus eupeus]ABR21060.1 venom K-channel toxin [Mesobuthus eupeus]
MSRLYAIILIALVFNVIMTIMPDMKVEAVSCEDCPEHCATKDQRAKCDNDRCVCEPK